MSSLKSKVFLVLFLASFHSINGQGFFGGSNGGFSNSNMNFNQNRRGFGVIAFGGQQSDTNFNQNSNRGGFNNFGGSTGFFRAADADDENTASFRYASPYDMPTYTKPAAPKPSYPAPSTYPSPAPSTYPSPAPSVQCPQQLLVSCSPQVQQVPCSPPPPQPSY